MPPSKPSIPQDPSRYAEQQRAAIERWKQQRPGWIESSIAWVSQPLSWVVQQIVPVSLVESALITINSVAEQMTHEQALLEQSSLATISELQSYSLQHSDRLTQQIQQHAIAMATTSGAALGATGVGGLAFDISALLTLALRTIHQIGLCYGEQNLDEQVVLAILAASSAEQRSARSEISESLLQLKNMLTEEVVESKLEDLLVVKVVQSSRFFATREVARHLGRRMARRKAAQLVPMVGAVIGGTSNLLFIQDVGEAAQRLFQERWLQAQDK